MQQDPPFDDSVPLFTPCRICQLHVPNEQYTILTCSKCNGYVHPACSVQFPSDYLAKGVLFGDRYWTYTCSFCHPSGEIMKRTTIMWVSLVELLLFHLMKTKKGVMDGQTYWKLNRKYIPIQYYDSKDDILPLLIDYWPFVMRKETPKQFNSKFNGTLTLNITRYFIRMHDKPNYWALRNPVIPHSDARIQNRIRSFSKELTSHLDELNMTCIPELFSSNFSDICPIVDYKYEDSLLIQLQNCTLMKSDQKRLFRKLKVRKLKRDYNLQLFDLDMETSYYLHNTLHQPFEVDFIKHQTLQPMADANMNETDWQRLQDTFKQQPPLKKIHWQTVAPSPHLLMQQALLQQRFHVDQLIQTVDFVVLTKPLLDQTTLFIKTHYSNKAAKVTSQTRHLSNGIIAYYKDLMIGFGLISDAGEIYYLKIIPHFFHVKIAKFLIYHICQQHHISGHFKFYGMETDPMLPCLKEAGFVVEQTFVIKHCKTIRMALYR